MPSQFKPSDAFRHTLAAAQLDRERAEKALAGDIEVVSDVIQFTNMKHMMEIIDVAVANSLGIVLPYEAKVERLLELAEEAAVIIAAVEDNSRGDAFLQRLRAALKEFE